MDGMKKLQLHTKTKVFGKIKRALTFICWLMKMPHLDKLSGQVPGCIPHTEDELSFQNSTPMQVNYIPSHAVQLLKL